MDKDLTDLESNIYRQNILNNPYAIKKLQETTDIRGIPFEGRFVLLTPQVADFFEVDERTVKNYISEFNEELKANGYEVLNGNRLKDIKLSIRSLDGSEKFFTTIERTSQLAIFDFRAFLNLAMLLKESPRAAFLRKVILDVAITAITERVGSTKFINQRSSGFLHTLFYNKKYRKEFTDALDCYVELGPLKYGIYTNKVYECVFLEKAQEYRRILNLKRKDKIRDTMYDEVLNVISSFESGIANEIKKKAEEKGRRLTVHETDEIFNAAVDNPFLKPMIDNARIKMASRDLAFRKVLHEQLKRHIVPLDPSEYEKFLGETSKSLEAQMQEAKDVLKRLKEGPDE